MEDEDQRQPERQLDRGADQPEAERKAERRPQAGVADRLLVIGEAGDQRLASAGKPSIRARNRQSATRK